MDIQRLNGLLSEEKASVLDISGVLEKTQAKLTKVLAELALEKSKSVRLYKNY